MYAVTLTAKTFSGANLGVLFLEAPERGLLA